MSALAAVQWSRSAAVLVVFDMVLSPVCVCVSRKDPKKQKGKK